MYCVNKGIVPHICGEAKKGKEQGGTEKVRLSPRKCINIPKRATNVDDLQKDVLHRSVLIIYSYKMVQFYSYVVQPGISFLMLLLLLLLPHKHGTNWHCCSNFPFILIKMSGDTNPTMATLGAHASDDDDQFCQLERTIKISFITTLQQGREHY
jgi:hypothetical protein